MTLWTLASLYIYLAFELVRRVEEIKILETNPHLFGKKFEVKIQDSLYQIILISNIETFIWSKNIFQNWKIDFFKKWENRIILRAGSMTKFVRFDKLYEYPRRKPGWRFTAGL